MGPLRCAIGLVASEASIVYYYLLRVSPASAVGLVRLRRLRDSPACRRSGSVAMAFGLLRFNCSAFPMPHVDLIVAPPVLAYHLFQRSSDFVKGSMFHLHSPSTPAMN